MTTSWDERQVLRDIVDGVSAFVEAQELDHTKLDPIKFNKLLYLTVEHFELPVTYRWYKYGSDFTPHRISVNDVHSTPLDELPSPDTPRINTIGGNQPPSPRDVKEFLEANGTEIEHLFEDDTKAYLRRFYEDYAPESLAPMYAACAVFQKTLDCVGHAEDMDRGSAVVEYVDTLLAELETLTREVRKCPDVADVDELYVDYADLLKDVLVTVEDMDGDLTPAQDDLLRELVEFFYNRAWLVVALKIAVENTEGQSTREWRKILVQRFNTQIDSYERDLQSLRKQCERSGLVADELRAYHGPNVRQADQARMRDMEEEIATEWENASKEANRQL